MLKPEFFYQFIYGKLILDFGSGGGGGGVGGEKNM